VAAIAAQPSLREALLARVTSVRADAARTSAVARGLTGNPSWSMPERLRIAEWLRISAEPQWREWLGDEQWPSADASDAVRFAYFERLRNTAPALPATTILDDPAAVERAAVLSSEEELAIAYRRFTADAPLPLTAAELRCGNFAALAAIFDAGYLDKLQADQVVEAFHRLDWRAFGSIKTEYLQRVDRPSIATDPHRRFEALRLWARGDATAAVEAFDHLFGEAPPADTATAREYLIAAAVRRGRGAPAKHLSASLELLQQSDPASAKWLARILDGRPVTRAEALELLRGDAPPSTDPLFVSVAVFLNRQVAPLLPNETSLWLRNAEPRWSALLPPLEAAYAHISGGLQRNDANVTAILRSLLLLPVDAGAMRMALLKIERRRPNEFLHEDGTPTPLGAAAIDCCIRTIEHLLAAKAVPQETADKLVADGSPQSIVAATLTILQQTLRGL